MHSGHREPDRVVFTRLLSLLGTPGDRASPLPEWDAGEQELAIETLADQLADRHVPVAQADRGGLLAIADRYAVAERVRSSLRWCPNPEAEDERWQVLEGSDRAAMISSELAVEIVAGHVLHGVTLTPWLACGACDDVLVRLDAEDVQAGRVPYRVAVVHPTWSRRSESLPWPSARVYASALDALDRLETCFA